MKLVPESDKFLTRFASSYWHYRFQVIWLYRVVASFFRCTLFSTFGTVIIYRSVAMFRTLFKRYCAKPPCTLSSTNRPIKVLTTVIMNIVTIMVCHVYAVTISGTISSGDGSGIQGVTVRLGKARLTTTTNQDGSFILTGTSYRALHRDSHHVPISDCPFTINNRTLLFSIAKRMSVRVKVYDVRGRLLFAHDQIISGNNRAINVPSLACGMHLFCVSVNRSDYRFKDISGIVPYRGIVSSLDKSDWITAVNTGSSTDDALLCSREGYQLVRLAVSTFDTSGIAITMVPSETGMVTDSDGNVYRTVRYGSQVWTVENLRTTTYSNGEGIPLVTIDSVWSQLSTPAYCFYADTTDTTAQRKWGALYNWYAVNTGKLAPVGWHVPSDAEWDTLQNYLIAHGYNFDGTIEDNKIGKSMSAVTDWLQSTETGSAGFDTLDNNISAFSGLPDGYCDYFGESHYRNYYAFWWTATERDSLLAWTRCLSFYMVDLARSAFGKMYGLPIRIVRDN